RLSSDTPNLSFHGANSSILFPPTSGANAPMIYLFASETENSPRMVLAHSPAYPDWGLQYDDAPDKFHFVGGGIPVMTVELGFNGGVGIGTTSPSSALEVIGEARATVFTPTSDRAAKENFQSVNAQEVLAKVAALPIARWSFKALPGAEHIGPVAQDFHAAFGVGTDDKHIATVDADGVALAAIQGLNQKVDQQRAELQQKETEITELKHRLERLEKLINEGNGGAR
ncbi:MAG TPA: tail fiber domain-containing protein, partial [Verrucomicrobiae bacterium]|nr:tail fiber domain-containing protein [Verrucomicrobiae bacterium]